MPVIVYSLENAIDTFFLRTGPSVSKKRCDDIVLQSKIIQFREEDSLLDVEMLALAKSIHGDIVPACSELGWIGDSKGPKLAIYEMDRLPGENYIITRFSSTHDKRLATVHSLARFFAQSWQRGLFKDLNSNDVSAIRTECCSRFEYLTKNLPERFQPAVINAQTALSALLNEHYPLVLTHSDLNEMNILVEADSGVITAIVDWAGASILPFGFTLYALENALGSMDAEGWTWFDDVDDLRGAFWSVFLEQTGLSEPQTELIKLAGKAGILIRYGTTYDSGFSGMIGVRDPNHDELRYLDALLF
ncbi:hypothetical protein CFIMG_007158RA [Ceratocystis fimbriata CBS 114723]|uniref:Aminoglycoside phosphotransferase domain-containing protein n=1 Tax=Ceratocystis fimbriata CBS 114723 TaxID=1035309 RepID=A0A2C5WSZ5_9PEZI|nr:hypothetical protein CFIMG_007158RA [Ceratocystis fimbriata CBS 114723]